ALEVDALPGIGPPIELPKPEPAHVGWKIAPASVRQGDAAVISMDMFVAPGYHTYPPGEEAGLPVRMKTLPPAGISLEGPLRAPPPTREAVFFGEKCKVYEGTVRFEQTVRISPDAAPGEIKIPVESVWQVCDDKQCQEGSDKGSVTLTIVARTSSDPPVTPPTTSAPMTSTASTATSASGGDSLIGKYGLVLGSVIAGLLNLLMPCTFPMIPITVSIFSKGKKLSRGKTAWRAAAYAAGIIISFTLVGGVVQAALGAEGQQRVNSLATNGPINLIFGAAFVYFALSFYGYYDLDLPAFVKRFVETSVSKAQKTPAGETGVPTIALFLMGLFFVVTSYTCGAPIILGLIATVGGSGGSVIAATAIFGATTALPFFVLALVPGAAKSLPKGGGWFHSLKVVLGTLELGAALKFLSNADIYWRWGILTMPVFLVLWVLCAAFMWAYVAGIVRFAHDEPLEEGASKIRVKPLVASLPFIALTCVLASGLNSVETWPGMVSGFLPPDPYPGTEASKPDKKPKGLPEFPSYEKALEAAKKSGKLLLLEFTGHV
ncbi:hypothetical protein HY251_08495, partial [bacterium]|nr:hypothetical protein [bacterium]